LSVLKPIVAILATINTKSKEVHFIGNVLKRAGATPWIVDLSMKPHNLPLADITGEQVARLAGKSWIALDVCAFGSEIDDVRGLLCPSGPHDRSVLVWPTRTALKELHERLRYAKRS